MPKEREHLKKLRIKCGYTQQEVADKLGVAKATISKYEKGLRKLNHIDELAALYGVDEAYIFLGKSFEELKKEKIIREGAETAVDNLINKYSRFIVDHSYLLKMLNKLGVELEIVDLLRISIRYEEQETVERISELLNDLESIHEQNIYNLKRMLKDHYGFDINLDEED